jgi:glycolate oxidase iron-sulfur subunit
MLHRIEVSQLGPQGKEVGEAITACVHCGFCLPACPTYVALGEEMDSPRGRIFLMKDVLEGGLPLDEALPYVDRCLGCLGCVTACPSGVAYGALITSFRGHAEQRRRRSLTDRFFRHMVLQTLPYPARFRAAARLGKIGQLLRPVLPQRLRNMLELLPPRLPAADPLPERIAARGKTRARVALLAGCAQQVLAPEINRATVEVLSANGVEVAVPPGQGCCGALAAHTGALPEAIAAARRNVRAFRGEFDAIVTNAAGCGSGMHEYPLWLKGLAEHDEAAELSAKVVDVCVFLDRLGLTPPPPLRKPLKAAYHDACHLAHGQGVTAEPRRVLRSIPNLELLEPADGHLCCGSAGTYNLEHPATARELGRQKAANLRATGADMVVTGNIGCLMQIRTHLGDGGPPTLPVKHTVELLAEAYRGAT